MSNEIHISRKLVLSSPLDLCKLLMVSKDLIDTNGLLNDFTQSVKDYIEGCQCKSDGRYDKMMSMYREISSNETIVNKIKSHIKCDSIIFDNDLLI